MRLLPRWRLLRWRELRWRELSRHRRFAIGALLALAALAVVPPTALELAVRLWPYPDALAAPPPPSSLVLDRAGQPLAAFVSPRDEWCLPLTLAECGPWLPAAVVAVEDRSFAQHDGVDWPAIAAAAWQNLRAGRVVRGASTITMQVQRLRDPRPRTIAAKLAELVRARQLERRLDKDALLGEWLNRAPFGGNLTGAGAAAWRWYGRPCAELTLAQAALLAGLPQNPARLRPDRHPVAAMARRDHVLACMRASGVIDADQLAAALAEPLDAAWHALPQDELTAALPALAGDRDGGVRRTTFDATLLRRADDALRAGLAPLAASGVDGAALVVVENAASDTASGAALGTEDGVVRAAVSLGGAPGLDLTACARSTGSALKPFIYGAAFADRLCRPEDPLDDLPTAWGAFAPRDFDRGWRGRLSAAEALAESRNLPAMALLARLGLERTGSMLDAFGLSGSASARRAGLTLATGGLETSPRRLALAYAALARGAGGASAGSLPPSACRQVLRCLADPARTAAVCPAAVAVGPAWKTGTSSGQRDAWCAAVTPRWTVVVWFGALRGAGTPALVGASAAAGPALALLATLDGGPAGWDVPDRPTSDESLTDESRPAAPLLPPPLAITSPAAHAVIAGDPERPGQRPRLPLDCRGAVGRAWWFVDGDPLGSTAAGQPLWWDATPGSHELRVVDEAGRGASVSLAVR